MEAVFIKLADMSVTASIMVLAVVIVRLIFRKAPKWSFCVLWGLVALRLMLPFSIESALSLIPSAEPVSRFIQGSGTVGADFSVSAVGGVTGPIEVSEPYVTYPRHWGVYTVLTVIWLAGAVLMLLYTLISSIAVKNRVAAATKLEKGIYQSENVDSPFVFGIIFPRIYVPYSVTGSDLSYIIAHERSHIRRRDHWWKPLGFLLLSVYWFNPVLWLAYILLCRDIEASCDEMVLKDLDADGARAYSTVLLNFNLRHRQIAACPVAFGEVGVKERIKNIMNYKKPTFWVIIGSVVICVLVAVLFLTNPTKAKETEEEEVVPEPLHIETLEVFYSSPNFRVKVEIDSESTVSVIEGLLDYEALQWGSDVTKLEPEEYYKLEINGELTLLLNSLGDGSWFIDRLDGGKIVGEATVDSSLADYLYELIRDEAEPEPPEEEPEEISEEVPEEKPEPEEQPEEKPEEKPEKKPEQKPEEKPEQKPEEKPVEKTPDQLLSELKSSAVSFMEYGGYLWYTADGWLCRTADGENIEKLYELPINTYSDAPVLAGISILDGDVALSYYYGGGIMGYYATQLFGADGVHKSEISGYGALVKSGSTIVKTEGWPSPEPNNLFISTDDGSTWSQLGEAKYVYNWYATKGADGNYTFTQGTDTMELRDGYVYMNALDASGWAEGKTEVVQNTVRVNIATGETTVVE